MKKHKWISFLIILALAAGSFGNVPLQAYASTVPAEQALEEGWEAPEEDSDKEEQEPAGEEGDKEQDSEKEQEDEEKEPSDNKDNTEQESAEEDEKQDSDDGQENDGQDGDEKDNTEQDSEGQEGAEKDDTEQEDAEETDQEEEPSESAEEEEAQDELPLEEDENADEIEETEDMVSSVDEAERIVLNQTSAKIYEGETIKLRATVYPETVQSEVTFTSSDEEVAQVSENGVVTGILASDEPVSITAQADAVSAVCLVTVLKSDAEDDKEEYWKDEDGEIIQITDTVWVAGYVMEGLEYTGKTVKQQLRVYDRNKLLKEKTDYTLTYKNAVKVAQTDIANPPSVTIKMKGQYSGSRTLYYSISSCPIEKATVKKEGAILSYNGKNQKYQPTLTYQGKKLALGKDYTISYQGNLKGNSTGKTEITYYITGKGNFTNDEDPDENPHHYYIVGKKYNLSKATILLGVKSLTLSEEEIKPEDLRLRIQLAGSTKKINPLDDEESFTVELFDCDKTGTGKVRVSSAGEESAYMGYVEKKFTIKGYNLKDTVSFTENWQKAITYSKGEAKTGIRQATEGILVFGEEGEEEELVEGTDYTVTYSGNKKVGTAKAVFKGINRFSGSLTKSYRITAADTILVTAPASVKYTAGGAIPVLEVTGEDGVPLTKKTDYTVQFSKNRAVGTGTYVVTGKGNFAGARAAGEFTIEPGSLSDCRIIMADAVYSTKKGAFKKKPVIYDTNGKKLTIGVDYSREMQYSYEDTEIPEVGSMVSVTVTGMGNYEGSTVTGIYHIYAKNKSIDKLFITIDSQAYTGNLLEPALVTEPGSGEGDIHVYLKESDQKKKKNEVDASSYVKIEGYSSNRKVGFGKVTLAGVNAYGGRKTYKFKIVPKKWLTNDVKKLAFKEQNVRMEKDATKALKLSIEPLTADKSLKWTFSNEENFKFGEFDEEKGTIEVTATGYGSCKVTAQSKVNGRSTSCTIKCLKTFDVQDEFGAIPNDGKDDARAITHAIEEANNMGGGIVRLRKGTYDIATGSRSITFWYANDVHLVMESGAVLKAMPTSATNYKVIEIINSKNCDVTGGKIIGEKDRHTGSGGEWGHCIAVQQSKNIEISNIDISGGWGDGIWVGDYSDSAKDSTYVTISNCNIHNNRRNNISITCADYVTINDCTLSGARGTDPQFGIDIETNYPSNPCSHIYLNRVIMTDNAKGAMGIMTPAVDVVLTDCKLYGNVYIHAGQNIKFIRTTHSGGVLDDRVGIIYGK